MDKLCSVVIPVYNESGNLEILHQKLSKAVEGAAGFKFEFIMVDDGSGDGSFEILKKLNASDNRVKAVKLSRNYGSHIALSTGLKFASGDCAAMVAADLQEPPDLIPRMCAKWAEGNDIIWAVHETREDTLFVRFMSKLFYSILKAAVLPQYVVTTADSCLIGRKAIDAVNSMKEQNRMLFGMISWTGFNQAYITYVKGKRHSGSSKWNMSKKLKLAVDSLLSMSALPVKLITLSGVLAMLCFFAAGAAVAAKAVITSSALNPAYALLCAVGFVSGLQLLAAGVLGEYLWRTLEETRAKPLSLVSEKVGL